MTQVQLYGEFLADAHWSHAVVSRGIAEGLAANGIEVWCKNTIGSVRPDAEQPPSLCMLPKGAQHGTKMPDPDIGFYIGGNPAQIYPRLWFHRYKVALVVFETLQLPAGWAAEVDRLDLVVVPSQCCCDTLVAAGIASGKIMVSRHGLDQVFGKQLPRRPPPPNYHAFIHFAGGPADLADRKGTPQLIDAFARVFRGGSRGSARLTVRVPLQAENANGCDEPLPHYSPLLDQVEKLELPEHCAVELDNARRALSPCAVADYMNLRGKSAVVVVQPSRIEGFGLVPLQARALGLPVILTAATGHLEHIEPYDTGIIVQDEPTLLRHDGFETMWEATAPDVTASDIAVGILNYLDAKDFCWRTAVKYSGPGYARRWEWALQTRRLAELLKEMG